MKNRESGAAVQVIAVSAILLVAIFVLLITAAWGGSDGPQRLPPHGE